MKVLGKTVDWKMIVLAVVFLFVALYPVLGAKPYHLHIFVLFFIWAMVASSWNLLNGIAGINSLGNVGFMAIGGYASAIIAKQFGFPTIITIPIGGILATILVTIFLGLPTLRLKGVYITLLTLIFADTLPTILTQTREVTGGATGLHEIPPFFEGAGKIENYYICFIAFIVVMYVIHRTIKSKTGLAFVALRDSEPLASSLGVSRFRERVKVFAISAFLCGIAGGFYVHSLGDISPTTLAIEPFLMGIAMMELGGIGTLFGPVLGAGIIVFGGEFLRLADTLRMTLLGAIICLTILFFPGGLMDVLKRFANAIDKRFSQKKPKTEEVVKTSFKY
jgi:branched-chain amino acid transport system permease protein